ncbi:MAG: hypothetical protein WC823_00655 [Parcubacteria group bacterium]|jgi:hypothetical protein
MKTANLKVLLDGRRPLILRPADHKATGGEGAVYIVGGIAIKIYSDPKRMRREALVEKIKSLATLQHPYIVAPKGVVCAESGEPIGCYMDAVEGEPLARVFTNDFRARQQFTEAQTNTLVARMREVVLTAHKAGALLVDANELNWLAKVDVATDPEPRVIDVDSWAIGRWPATVIMPSIHDWHTKGFTQLSDWFSWGIVTFQIYTGIHPYKGVLAGYARQEFERRMKENASVFTPGVKLNHAVRDFSGIPGPLRDWYVKVFRDGKRLPPPSPFAQGVPMAQGAVVARMITTAIGNLIHEKIYAANNDQVIRLFPCGVALLASGKLIELDSGNQIGMVHANDCEVVRAKGGWLVAEERAGKFAFNYIRATNFLAEPLTVTAQIRRIMRFENRLFAVLDNGLAELVLAVLGKQILSVGHVWGAMVKATLWFDGVGIQDTFGAMYVIAPFGEKACAQVRVRELDKLRVVSAKAGNRFMAFVGLNIKGEYQKIELTFDREYRTYQVWIGDADGPDLNMALLPKGVMATIVNDGELVIFVPGSGAINKIQDKYIGTDLILGEWDNQVVYVRQGVAWRMRMQ